jgi:hypothetical protein
LTLPAATDTLVGKATTDTLTNKTLTTPSVSSPTISDGTANGVAFLNGSKVLTTGSALTYNGTDLAISGRITSTVASNAAYQIAGVFTNATNADFLVQLKNSYTQIGPSTATPISFAIAGTQAMTLDASGNLGVGTTTPNASYRLDIAGNSGIRVSGSTVGSVAIRSASGYSNFVNFNENTVADRGVIGFDAGSGSMQFRVNGAYDLTTGTQAMTLDASGNLLVGATSATNNTNTFSKSASGGNPFITVNTASSNPYGIQSRFSAVDPNNTIACYYEAFNAFTNTLRFEVRSNGGIANYSANDVNLSDRREKTNFAPAGSYLDKICAIPVQTFNYIDQNLETDDGLTLGVVAQDVQAVAPELVMESNWAGKDAEPKMRLSIYQTDLQYALMKCIQEQQALITQLTARITALEGA